MTSNRPSSEGTTISLFGKVYMRKIFKLIPRTVCGFCQTRKEDLLDRNQLEIHHIFPQHQDWHHPNIHCLENLIVLCTYCHKKVHHPIKYKIYKHWNRQLFIKRNLSQYFN